MAQQLFYFILFLNNNIIITSNKIMWGITTCFEVGQVGKYITNLILKDFKETKYLVKNLLRSCM